MFLIFNKYILVLGYKTDYSQITLIRRPIIVIPTIILDKVDEVELETIGDYTYILENYGMYMD